MLGTWRRGQLPKEPQENGERKDPSSQYSHYLHRNEIKSTEWSLNFSPFLSPWWVRQGKGNTDLGYGKRDPEKWRKLAAQDMSLLRSPAGLLGKLSAHGAHPDG